MKYEGLPTLKQIVDSYDMSPTAFADHFRMESRIMQKWYRGEKQCPEFIRDFLIYIIEEEIKQNNE